VHVLQQIDQNLAQINMIKTANETKPQLRGCNESSLVYNPVDSNIQQRHWNISPVQSHGMDTTKLINQVN